MHKKECVIITIPDLPVGPTCHDLCFVNKVQIRSLKSLTHMYGKNSLLPSLFNPCTRSLEKKWNPIIAYKGFKNQSIFSRIFT